MGWNWRLKNEGRRQKAEGGSSKQCDPRCSLRFLLPSAFCLLPSSMKLIPKSGPINATVTAPPSKSYSVRALLLAAMSEGTTVVRNCLDADDTRYAFEALKTIG